MLFNSYIFIFIFLPLVLAGWYFLNSRGFYQTATCFLAAMSLWFYGYFNPYYLGIILVSILGNYLLSFLLRFSRTKLSDRIFLLAGLAFNLGFLFYFKYYDFFFENINAVFHTNVAMHNILLPLGISFFTFQQVSFIVDRCQHKAEHYPFIDYVTFVTFFPQLVAGPIVLYKEMMPQFADKHLRSFNRENFAKGIALFTLGLSKKVLLANTIGLIWTQISAMNPADVPLLTAWIGILAFTFQIYFDFSGYSDMAIGLGQMFGFTFLENFNYPYMSKSITEFWRRWHISLSTWFRDYVYIPLGGNRRGLPIQIRNILIVWMLTGVWHGASWNFVAWGLFFGVLLTAEKLFLLKWLEKAPSFVSHLYTMLMVILSWALFAFDSLSAGFSYIGAMFGAHGAGLYDSRSLYLLLTNGLLLLVGAIGCTSLPKRAVARLENGRLALSRPAISTIAAGVVLLAISTLSVAYLVDASYNPFLYFRF